MNTTNENLIELPRRPSLGAMLAQLSQLDELMGSSDLDPAALIGDIRDKVDAIKTVVDDLEDFAVRMQARAMPYQKAARAASASVERLKEYVLREMEANAFEKLPGEAWRAQLQANGQAALIFNTGHETPTDADATAFPGLVKMYMVTEWNRDAVKTFLEGGESLPFAKLERGKHVRFYINKGTKAVAQSKSKKETT